jgi:S-layer homology domain
MLQRFTSGVNAFAQTVRTVTLVRLLPASLMPRLLLGAAVLVVPAAAVVAFAHVIGPAPARHAASAPRQPVPVSTPKIAPTHPSPTPSPVPTTPPTPPAAPPPVPEPIIAPPTPPMPTQAPATPAPTTEVPTTPAPTTPAPTTPDPTTPDPTTPDPTTPPVSEPIVVPPPVIEQPVPGDGCDPAAVNGFSDAGVSDAIHARLEQVVAAGLLTTDGNDCFEVVGPLGRAVVAVNLAWGMDLPTPQPAAQYGTFTDVNAVNYYWAYQSVEALSAAGLMQGVSADTFGPGLSWAPEQTAALFAHAIQAALAGQLPPTATAPACDLTNATTFSDAAASDTTHAHLGDLVAKGLLVRSNTDRCFIVTPGEWDTHRMLRQEFATALTYAVDLAPYAPATATFTDVPPDNYAFAYVEAVYRAGLMNGVAETRFGYNSVISPQDMTLLFKRALA